MSGDTGDRDEAERLLNHYARGTLVLGEHFDRRHAAAVLAELARLRDAIQVAVERDARHRIVADIERRRRDDPPPAGFRGGRVPPRAAVPARPDLAEAERMAAIYDRSGTLEVAEMIRKLCATLTAARAERQRLWRMIESLTADASANAAKARDAQAGIARLRAAVAAVVRELRTMSDTRAAITSDDDKSVRVWRSWIRMLTPTEEAPRG